MTNNPKSSCCLATMTVKGETTRYYICDKCGNPCDPIIYKNNKEKKCECDEKHICSKCVCPKCKTCNLETMKCDCSSTPTEDWEKEFDRLWDTNSWGWNSSEDGWRSPPGDEGDETTYHDYKIKSFIRSLLSQAREEAVEEYKKELEEKFCGRMHLIRSKAGKNQLKLIAEIMHAFRASLLNNN